MGAEKLFTQDAKGNRILYASELWEQNQEQKALLNCCRLHFQIIANDVEDASVASTVVEHIGVVAQYMLDKLDGAND